MPDELSGQKFVVIRFYRKVYEVVEGKKNLKRCFPGGNGVLKSSKQRYAALVNNCWVGDNCQGDIMFFLCTLHEAFGPEGTYCTESN